MIEKKYYFLAGLPRSGSTVLASILNQNSTLYTTPTSPLLDLLEYSEYGWVNHPASQTFPSQTILNLNQALINGCWEHISKNIIIEKCRGWVKQIPAIRGIFNTEPKVVVTVRDIPSILASYVRVLEQQNKPTYIDEMLISEGKDLTVKNIVDKVWQIHVRDCIEYTKASYEQFKKNILIVEYNKLVNTPEAELEKIYNFFDLPKFEHSFSKIENVTKEDNEGAWRAKGLHDVRANLSNTAKPAIDVLGEELVIKYSGYEFWR